MQRSIDILVELLMPEVTWHFPRGSKVRVDVASRLQTGCKQVASRCKQMQTVLLSVVNFSLYNEPAPCASV